MHEANLQGLQPNFLLFIAKLLVVYFDDIILCRSKEENLDHIHLVLDTL